MSLPWNFESSLPWDLAICVPLDEAGFLLQCLGLDTTRPEDRPFTFRSLDGPLLVSVGFEDVSHPIDRFSDWEPHVKMGVAILDTRDLTKAAVTDYIPLSTHLFSAGPAVLERQADSDEVRCSACKSLASDLSDLLPRTREIVLVGQERNLVRLRPLYFDWLMYDIAGIVRIETLTDNLNMAPHHNLGYLLDELECPFEGLGRADAKAHFSLRAALLLAIKYFRRKNRVAFRSSGGVLGEVETEERLGLIEDVGYGVEEEEEAEEEAEVRAREKHI